MGKNVADWDFNKENVTKMTFFKNATFETNILGGKHKNIEGTFLKHPLHSSTLS